jgi:hypothetical protein
LVFLMQIRAARMALEDARVRSWKSWKHQAISSSPHTSSLPTTHSIGASSGKTFPSLQQQQQQQQQQPEPWGTWLSGSPSLGAPVTGSLNAKEEDLVMQEMSHFVSNLDQFVVDRLLCGDWMQLEQVSG